MVMNLEMGPPSGSEGWLSDTAANSGALCALTSGYLYAARKGVARVGSADSYRHAAVMAPGLAPIQSGMWISSYHFTKAG
jgi:hypothetical protein